MREVQLTRESRGPSTQQENRSTEPGRGDPRPYPTPSRRGETKNIINLSAQPALGQGQESSALHPSSWKACGRFWGLGARGPRGPRAPSVRVKRRGGGGAGRGRGRQRSDRAKHLQPNSLGNPRPPGDRGLYQHPLRPLTAGPEHMGRPGRTCPSEGNFPQGPLSTQSAPKGEKRTPARAPHPLRPEATSQRPRPLTPTHLQRRPGSGQAATLEISGARPRCPSP